MTEFERGGRNNEHHHLHQAAFIKKRDNNNSDDSDAAAFQTSKRQRSMADRQEEEEQQQPPQTRRMVMDGMGCVGYVERLANSSHFLSVPSVKTTLTLPSPTDEQQAVVSRNLPTQTSLPKLINREESSSTASSVSSSTTSSSSGGGGGSSSARVVSESVFTPMTNAAATEGGGGELADSPARPTPPSSFSQKLSGSVQPPAERSEQSSSSDEWVCRANGEEVCENDIAHRMWSLKRRGFDEFLMRIMDEVMYEENSDESVEASQEGSHRKIDMDAAEEEEEEEEGAEFDGAHSHEPPLPQPIVVTPERLLL